MSSFICLLAIICTSGIGAQTHLHLPSRSQGQQVQNTAYTHHHREQPTFSEWLWIFCRILLFYSAHQNCHCCIYASRLSYHCFQTQFRGKTSMDLSPWVQTEVKRSPETFQYSLQWKWPRDLTLDATGTQTHAQTYTCTPYNLTHHALFLFCL